MSDRNVVLIWALLLNLVLMAAGCDNNGGPGYVPRHSPTATSTATSTSTATGTATATFSPTATVTRTVTPTATSTIGPTATATGSGVPTPSATPTSIACPGGSAFTIANSNSYPIWLAESYQGATTTIVEPPGNNWEIAPNSSVGLCMPSGWNGRFWPRTECAFDTLFTNDTGYQNCTTTADCTVNNTVANPHICYGGKCMLTCNTGSTPFCAGAGGLDNVSATCAPVSNSLVPSPAPTPMVCTFPAGTVCKTGDCAGLYQCYGTWDSVNTALQSAGAPVSLFEAAFTGTATVNYDVSLVNGYNTQVEVQPSVPASGASCYQPSCVSDLNATCPTNLQFTDTPTSNVSSIPCGAGTYCQSGACVNSTCVIGCIDPGDQCQPPNIPPTGLMCSSTLPNGETYEEMYLVKDSSSGVAMSSGNQGTRPAGATLIVRPAKLARWQVRRDYRPISPSA
ncbi:MAG: thaumatin family protein [Candidatus Binataceae bacterium]